MITLKEFFETNIGNACIHCRTREQANKLCAEFDKIGKTWENGKSYINNNNYRYYKNKTVYLNIGLFDNLSNLEEDNYTVYEFEDIIFDTPNEIIITYTDKEVTVKQGTKTATAHLHPEDKFDLKIGINIALDRLLKPTLTEDEKVILRNVDKKWKWIARDKRRNLLCIYNEKPKKTNENWDIQNDMRALPFSQSFQFIKWEDAEPYEISKLLEE